MRLYHGSYIPIEEPKIIKGKNTKDFGAGFLLHGYQRKGGALGKAL